MRLFHFYEGFLPTFTSVAAAADFHPAPDAYT